MSANTSLCEFFEAAAKTPLHPWQKKILNQIAARPARQLMIPTRHRPSPPTSLRQAFEKLAEDLESRTATRP